MEPMGTRKGGETQRTFAKKKKVSVITTLQPAEHMVHSTYTCAVLDACVAESQSRGGVVSASNHRQRVRTFSRPRSSVGSRRGRGVRAEEQRVT